MKITDTQKDAMFACGIPAYMHDGIVQYYENGIPPGGFLTAVIDNDLQKACGRADDTNRHCLFAYMQWFYNHAPSGTWGYPGATHEYCAKVQDDAA